MVVYHNAVRPQLACVFTYSLAGQRINRTADAVFIQTVSVDIGGSSAVILAAS